MEVVLRPSWKLTDEHPASSYGVPVLVNRFNNSAYRSGDVLEPYSSWGWINARVAVFRMLRTLQLDHVERAFVSKFGLSLHTHIRQTRRSGEYGYVKSLFKKLPISRWESAAR